MKIALVSSYVPFVRGGGRFIVEWLETKLIEAGHQVERIYIPFVDSPEHLLDQIAAFRLIDLSESCDRLIAFRPPSYVLPHPNKVLWFIHHIRIYYDLWDSPYRAVPDNENGKALRRALFELDATAIAEARKVFTNSQIVADRLKNYNGIAATPLYPPILDPSRFRHDRYGDEVVMICRLESHKRQKLLIEAMRHVRSGVRLRLCGEGSDPLHSSELNQLAMSYGVRDRVTIEDRWISEDEKAEYLASALAVAYAPLDEDSYGYPSLEGAHAEKCVVTTSDAGGVLELVENGKNGFVTAPEPRAVAEALDTLFFNRDIAASMGKANARRVKELRIDWPHVIEALTS